MSAKPEQKVLRIGIIQAGKIVEERLLRKRAKVTIGLSSKNMFVLPVGNLRSHTLFDLVGHGYELAFTGTMDGRVAVEGEALDLAGLKQKGLARARGDEFRVPLGDSSRGKVVLGDVTVLFQFVVPPPIPAPPKLPAVARGGWIKSIDWIYTAIVFAIATVEFGMVGYMRTLDIKKEPPKLENLDARFARLLVPELAKPPEPKKEAAPEKGAGKEEKKTEDEGKKKPKKEAKAKEDDEDKGKAETKPEEKRVVTERVAKVGILGALGPGAKNLDRSIANVFDEGKVDSDIDTSFKKADAVAIADSQGRTRAPKGGTDEGVGSAETVGDDKLTGTGTGKRIRKIAVREPEKREAPPVGKIGGGKLDLEQGEIEDPGAITAVIRRRIGAVKGCYDLALKRNPDTRGKVAVRFTIGETGAVVDISIEENTTGDDGVASCIAARVRQFRFPKPKSGKVTVAYPFILTASKG
jgi:hypothetical protein